MTEYVRLNFQCCHSSGKIPVTYSTDIRSKRTISLIKSWIKDIHGLDGTLYLKQNFITVRKTIADLQLKNGDNLQLKHFKKTRKALLVECSVRVSADEEHLIQVPVNCTVESLKFHIECTEKIYMEHQSLECGDKR